MDRKGTGKVTYDDFKAYTGRSGVQSLTEAELQSIFGDFSKLAEVRL